jgi:hypothetical protein
MNQWLSLSKIKKNTKMLFKKVNKKHILKGIKDFEEKGLPKKLWEKVVIGDKRHNFQMDVVLALWEADLIKKQ